MPASSTDPLKAHAPGVCHQGQTVILLGEAGIIVIPGRAHQIRTPSTRSPFAPNYSPESRSRLAEAGLAPELGPAVD
jgi:hypothetical protein